MARKSSPKTPADPVKVARARRLAALTRRDYIQLLGRLCAIALCGWLVFSQVFLITQCEGQAMFPAIEDGDLIIGYRLHREYAKGEVVVYTMNGKTYLGRIVAKEGDFVMMDAEDGKLQINGTTQSGEIMYPTYPKDGIAYPYRVSEGFFVLGDYRTQSEDSRDFGPVPPDNIQGKVITIVRRRGV